MAKFIVSIDDSVTEDQVADALWQGLQYYEDVEWTSFGVEKVEKEEK